ncbi:MAG: hypothetical protein P8Y92_14690 [Halioglobus sp.]
MSRLSSPDRPLSVGGQHTDRRWRSGISCAKYDVNGTPRKTDSVDAGAYRYDPDRNAGGSLIPAFKEFVAQEKPR